MTIRLADLLRASSPSVPYSEAAFYLRQHGEEIAIWIRRAVPLLEGLRDDTLRGVGIISEISKQLIEAVQESAKAEEE